MRWTIAPAIVWPEDLTRPMPAFCPACDASNPTASTFCSACGDPMGADPNAGSAKPRRASPRTASPPARRGRKGHGHHQIASAQRAIIWVRMFFLGVGALALILLTFIAIAWFAVDADFDEEVGASVSFALVVYAAVLVVCVLGVTRANRNPLPWALAAAGLLTLDLAGVVAQGAVPGIPLILLTLAAWGSVFPVLRLGRLIAEAPDNPALAALDATPDAVTRRRNRNARRSVLLEFRSAGIALVVIVAAVTGVIYLVGTIARATRPTPTVAKEIQPPDPVDPIVARFEAAWRAGDLEAMGQLYSPRLRARATRLDRRFEARGLKAPYPELRERRVGNYGRMKQAAQYTTARGPVEVVFEFVDGAWTLVALRLMD